MATTIPVAIRSVTTRKSGQSLASIRTRPKPISTPAAQPCRCQTRPLSVHVGQRRIIIWPSRDDWPQIRNEWRKGFRQDPVGISFAALFVTGIAAFVGWYCYDEYIRYKPFPPPVAKKLRQAMIHANWRGHPSEALQAFKEALVLCQEEGMDNFSDEVIGIKLSMAALLEKHSEYVQTISAMEMVMRECLAEANACRKDATQKKKRTRLLKWSVQIGTKLGELYARPEVWDRDAAEQRLSWAVETMVKENRRRQDRNVSVEEEGEWFSQEELAATIEGLAHTYESKNQHYLAAPLFLHAINLHPQKSCHTVVLMNNLASTLSQQSPRAAAAVQAAANSEAIVQPGPAPPPITREMLLEMASTWASRALEVSASIKPPDRNEECDIGCVVATHNLGELAEMTNNVAEAKRRYHEALSLAKAIGFQEGIEQSSERLRGLEGKA